MFANGPRDWGSVPGPVLPKIKKWYLMPPCLTLSTISKAILEKEQCPPFPVATRKGLRLAKLG